MGACLDALPQSDPYVVYLTQNLEYALCSAGEATDLSLTIAYNPEAVPAGQIVPVQDKAQAARAVRNAWDAGQKSAALLDEGTGWSQDEWFDIGRSALGNARTIVSYAGEGLYQTIVPENAEKRIVLLWEAEQQDKTAVDARRQETEAAIEEAAASLRAADAQDMRERYRAVHDWLCDHVKYDQAIYDATKADAMTPELMNAKSEYGAFVRGKTVCTGYAEGFYALCWRLGLPCAVVYGTQQGEGHAWNAVLVDGEKYFVDCTFDDTGGSRDRYFMFPPEKLTSLGYKLDPYCVIFWEENEENAISR
ncbi:MAG: transglutaminase domain-containing protein [Eubacteriales bacterium]|nr:transglutaminase domain-containing protein [Eubacteriales bacterium]